MVVGAASVDVVHHLIADQKPADGLLDNEPVLVNIPAAVNALALVAVRGDYPDVAFAVDEPATFPASGPFATFRVALLKR